MALQLCVIARKVTYLDIDLGSTPEDPHPRKRPRDVKRQYCSTAQTRRHMLALQISGLQEHMDDRSIVSISFPSRNLLTKPSHIRTRSLPPSTCLMKRSLYPIPHHPKSSPSSLPSASSISPTAERHFKIRDEQLSCPPMATDKPRADAIGRWNTRRRPGEKPTCHDYRGSGSQGLL